jgi:hypothetical protein
MLRFRISFTMDGRQDAPAACRASQGKVGRNFNWIWYVGAAVWFLNAALAMHHGNLRLGVTNAAIAAVFLAAGLFFRRMARRPPGRDSHR